MGIVVLSPYGLMREESGLLGLLANYLKKSAWQVSALGCNGIFSLCDRDGENGWSREVTNCFECMRQQTTLAKWSNVPTQDLSVFLSPEDILESKRWMLSAQTVGLYDALFRGINIYDVCRGSLRYRFGTETPDLKNKSHEQIVRRMMLSAVRASLAAENYNRSCAPEMALLSGGDDFITASYAMRSYKQAFEWRFLNGISRLARLRCNIR